MSEDMVNHPAHYNEADIECIDAMEALGICWKSEPRIATSVTQVLKYLWRANLKGKGTPVERAKKRAEDMKKAAWYLHRCFEVLSIDWPTFVDKGAPTRLELLMGELTAKGKWSVEYDGHLFVIELKAAQRGKDRDKTPPVYRDIGSTEVAAMANCLKHFMDGTAG